ncbi:MAG: DHHA1 domain-containing protein, partial [Chitinivibrionales bacterium]
GIFGNTGYSHIGRISTPDYVAEISDFLNSLEHITMTVTTGIFNHMLFFSVRTKNGVAASLIAERIAKDLNGTGGGHPNMAAGRIPTHKKEEQTIRVFKERLLSYLNLNDERTTKILPAIRR